MASKSRKRDVQWLIQTIVGMSAAAVLVFTLVWLTGFDTGAILPVVAVILALLAVLYGIMCKTQNENWFYIGVLAFALITSLLFRRQILEGFRIFWNESCDAMLAGTGFVVPKWELQLGEGQRHLSALLFGSLGTAMVATACFALVSYVPAWMAALHPALIMGGIWLFGAEAKPGWLAVMLGLSLVILLYSGWKNSNAVSAVALSWLLCGLFAMFLLGLSATPAFSSWIRSVGETVQHELHAKQYETTYTTLPEGDFRDFKEGGKKSSQALVVTMEVPQQLYLRGFTGAEFTGERWESLDRDALAKNQQLLYWLNLNAFDQNAQFAAATKSMELQRSTVTVQNIGACSYYLYAPFSINEGDWTDGENLNADGIYGDGVRNYVYTITNVTAQTIEQVLTNLQNSEDAAVLQYRRAESGYRQFIYHYYLQVPESVTELLGERLDAIAAEYGGADSLTSQQAQECALVFLKECFPEEETEEEMELPLDIAKGTSYQYATVAAMTLRYYGIPARYAEGYVITEEMAAELEAGETLKVDSSCAMAWVEVYQDGIGWIPMDLTPGVGQVPEYSDPDAEQESKDKPNKEAVEKKEEEEQQEEQQQEPEPTGGTMVMLLLKQVLSGLLILIAVLVLIFVILWIRRKILLGQMQKRFESENTNDAVSWIYKETAVLLEVLGFDRGNGSMRALTEPLKERFGEDYAALYEQATDLNDRALFSSKMLGKAERDEMLKFRRWTLRNLTSEMKWYQRMWIKWVRCLY